MANKHDVRINYHNNVTRRMRIKCNVFTFKYTLGLFMCVECNARCGRWQVGVGGGGGVGSMRADLCSYNKPLATPNVCVYSNETESERKLLRRTATRSKIVQPPRSRSQIARIYICEFFVRPLRTPLPQCGARKRRSTVENYATHFGCWWWWWCW